MSESQLFTGFALASCAMLSVAFAAPAHAQQGAETTSRAAARSASNAGPGAAPESSSASAKLEEIVVTAQKRAENLQRVPISVVATTDAQIENAGLSNIQQLNTIVPSVNVRNNAGGVQFYVRGVGTAGSNVENPIAAYVDDVYIANQRTVGFDLLDVTQVAVLKGPQGTLFGRNATGGVLQVSTRDPSQEAELRVRTGIDNYETWRTGIFVGGPLTDGVRASLAGSYVTQNEGWGHDSFANYDTFRIKDKVNTRGKLLFDFNDNVHLKLSADYQKDRNTNGLNEVAYPGTVLRFEPGRVGGGDYYDSRGNNPAFQELEEGGGSAQLGADLGFAEFRSISAYRKGNFQFQIDADRTPATAQNINNKEVFNSRSQELQLVSPTSEIFSWVLGAFYFRYVDGDEPINVQLKGPIAPLPTSLGQTITYGTQKATSYSGFGQATARILPETRLTVGLRYTTEDREYDGRNPGVLNNGTVIANLSPAVQNSITANNWTWRLALDHQFSDDILGYVSYDRGFKSGGFNVSSITNPPYLPEQLDAYSVGLKSELLDRRLRLNTSLFYYDYKNVQVVSYTIVPIANNGASARMYGLDADLEARISSHFFVTGGLSVLDTKFTDYKNATFSIPQPNASVVLVSGDATGNEVPFASPIQATASLNYTFDTGFGNFLFSLSDSYNSRFYFEADNRLKQPAYNYLGVSGTWRSTDDRYSVRLWGTNLLDERVGTTGATQTLGYPINYGNPPLLVGVTFEARL